MATRLTVGVDFVPGIYGAGLVVRDQDGDLLPGVIKVETATEVGARGTVTITFVVDGENVRLA